jgi:hypothetical protein
MTSSHHHQLCTYPVFDVLKLFSLVLVFVHVKKKILTKIFVTEMTKNVQRVG